MDPQRQQTLWAIAVENCQATLLTAQHGWHNGRVTVAPMGCPRPCRQS